ncbi:MAG: hypothetical protein UV74_C0013G0198 [Candidatus Woesebacteria bacterium GW2011_GWB1_43_14]|uniref:Uncharacterized protein n=1 Tax=Candidatus Woesebacteria bacterium GW2011_GWB1_43_14 TaxID=1618578 RepID=A0A0G1FPX0_9BACT|nr:MAG: hypothetical protein UT21_C0005G0023 [Candidatus Woesebacteria bacterium GW2011_GWA1_39_11b]KKS77613.1 MAG: hypothetical protein UV51_C0005G0023 [Candidatus Woesebacteria bacterium GW2011_GWC1_42_9]KKS97076.1 MAG: hypothetical protein UV74_C0013G0198 [Candidatus Woesebacteria bacterium GW2011_GWB1_43_14]
MLIRRIVNSFLILFALFTLALIGYYLTKSVLNMQTQEFPTRVTFDKKPYREAYGSLKYAQGECDLDNECEPSGCSEEVCSSDPNINTACEIKKDFPDNQSYRCGCFDSRCAWIEK